MLPNIPSSIEVFQGNRIEDPTELRFLELIVSDLAAKGSEALIFMNFYAGRQRYQVDSLVITKSTVCLVEVKGYLYPVKGSQNGTWKINRFRNGIYQWEEMRGQNGYNETLTHKMAMSDDMHQFAKECLFNPRESADKYYKLIFGCLCFVPDIPEGSELPESDYKVSILGYQSGFQSLLKEKKRPSWTFDQWREFARWLKMEPFSEVNLATQRTIRNPVEEYQEQFTQTRISNWIPTRLLSQGNSVTSNEIKNCLRNGQSCVIEGKSGIGKSCLAYNLVAELGCKECLAIPFKALFFRDNLEEILDDTVGSYVASTLNQILTHAKATGKRLILLVDGWNECNPDLRPLLAQKLDKMVNRHQATLLITSQFTPKEISTAFEVFTLNYLERSDKIAIGNLDEHSVNRLSSLIDVISTGVDAKIIGEIAEQLEEGISRAELFDIFIRTRLGESENALAMFDIMVTIATSMHESLENSVSIQKLNRLVSKQSSGALLLDSLIKTGIFQTDIRQGSASFTHELYQHFFAGEGLVRKCPTSQALKEALERPKNEAIQMFALGAFCLDRPLPSNIAEIVNTISSSRFFEGCLSGLCGSYAQQAAEKRIDLIFERLFHQVRQLHFTFYENDSQESLLTDYIKLEKGAETWTEADYSVFKVIAKRLARGLELKRFLELAALADQRLFSESQRLSALKKDGKSRFSQLFSEVYVVSFSTHRIGIGSILSVLNLEFWRQKLDAAIESTILDLLYQSQELTPGQLYFLLIMTRVGNLTSSNEIIKPMLTLIPEAWKRLPYHARLELMRVVRAAGHQSNDELLKKRVAEVVMNLPSGHIFIDTSIVDALSALDALESQRTENDYYIEIQQILKNPDDKQAQASAYGLYNMQFDHPTDEEQVYQAIENLSPREKGMFLLIAARGMNKNACWGGSLLSQLCKLLPTGAEEIFLEHCKPPNLINNSFPQETIDKFVRAVIGLARMGVELPNYASQDSELAKTWLILAEIYYWINCNACEPIYKEAAIQSAWSLLLKPFRQYAWLVLACTLNNPFRGDGLDYEELLPRFADEIKDLASQELKSPQAVSKPNTPLYRLDWLGKPIETAIRVLGEYGTTEDREDVLRWVDDKEYGQSAINALRSIEHRSGS